MLANEGMAKNGSFCAATPSAMVFGKSDGDRFAVTRDLTLKPGYVLQFKVSTRQGSSQSRRRTENSHFYTQEENTDFSYSVKEGTHLNENTPGLGW